MKSKSYLGSRKRLGGSRRAACLLALAAVVGWPAAAVAGAPDWLQALARTPLPSYPDDTDAVILLDERVTTVKENGEMESLYRRAYKILRPQGREQGMVAVHFDNETLLTYLKGWCIPAQGGEYEVKEKDAVETSGFGAGLYADTRHKLLRIPAAEPGNVIGYEYRQRLRPNIFQDIWWFQQEVPLRQARFILQLPQEWEFKSVWLNHPPVAPTSAQGNQTIWELRDVPAVEREPGMPHWRAVAGHMAVALYPPATGPRDKAHGDWQDIALWYARLASGRRAATPEIRQKVGELTATAPTPTDKLRALAAFVQRGIRYVAIEIGIGGYQPHSAHDVLTNAYGDCKDKATLLSTMLREIGIESHYTLVHTRRGVIAPNFPSMLNFNHAILAIQLPPGETHAGIYSVAEHKQLGRLLFFDPTDPFTPLGYLPPTLQANYGLLVTENGGELLELPLAPPATNRLLRTAQLVLEPNGRLSGGVREIRWGAPGVERRVQLLEAPAAERVKVVEEFLGQFLSGFILHNAQAENLEEYDKSLVLTYRFAADNYAKAAGDLLLVRPRVFGQKSSSLLERKERKQPVEFPTASLDSDIIEIKLPEGYQVDELPPPVTLDYGFAQYRSKVEADGNLIRYSRMFQIQQVRVPAERLGDLKRFYRHIADDERNSAVLKRTPLTIP